MKTFKKIILFLIAQLPALAVALTTLIMIESGLPIVVVAVLLILDTISFVFLIDNDNIIETIEDLGKILDK